MPPTSPSSSSDPQWTKHDSAELSTAMAQILVDHRQEIYKWPAFQNRWTNQRADKILFSKLKQFARDGLVKPFGGEMPAGPRGGASGSGRAKKEEESDEDEFDTKKGVLRGGVRKREERKVKVKRDSLFDGDSDGEADSESEEGSPSPRMGKKSTRQMAVTPMTPRPKPRPGAASAPASTSRRAIRDGSPEVITIDDSSDEDVGQSRSNGPTNSSRPLMLLDRRHHRGHSHDDDVETTSDGDGDGDSPGPLLLTPSQDASSSPTMDQWRSRVLYSGDSSQSPSQSRQTTTKKRPSSSSSARNGGSSGGGAGSSMQPPSSRLKRLKMPASGFDGRDYETSPTANRQQRGAAAQAGTKLHETRWTSPAEESDWEEEEEERQREERRGVAEGEEGTRQPEDEDEEQLEEDELEEDRSLVKSASRRSEMLAALFPSDHDDDELEV